MALFQAISWSDADIRFDDLTADEKHLVKSNVCTEKEENSRSHYVVTAYGRCEDGKSIATRLFGFHPYLYARIGNGCSPLSASDVAQVRRHVVQKVGELQVHDVKLAYLKEYYGFTNDEERPFVKISLYTKNALRLLSSQPEDLQKPSQESLWGSKVFVSNRGWQDIHPYEAHIEPLIRLTHILGVDPAGWVRIETLGKPLKGGHWANTDTCYSVAYNRATPVKGRTQIAPISMCSFDIECASRNKIDFPKPKQTYFQTANNIHDVHDRAVSKRWTRERTRQLIQICIFRALQVELDDTMTNAFEKAVSESVASRMDMSTVFPVTPADPDTLRTMTRMLSEDIDDILRGNYKYESQPQTPMDGDTGTRIGQTKLASSLMDKHLPKLLGDPIIQIGACFNTVGVETATVKWIGTLGGCGPVEDTIVQSFRTEADLLIGFRDAFVKYDPDIYIGYNVWGFDHNFLYVRAVELGIDKQFTLLSRLRFRPAFYKEQKLSSSAMGSNLNMTISIPGRVDIDLLHVIRNNHKFTSYSLNNVSKNVLNDEKDDVSPSEIFVLQDGDDKDRAVIAKYCVQDCLLVTRLAERLTVVINAMAMANVCRVPLQYIFSRGQGVKCTSLVAYECYKRGYVMKTHDRNISVNMMFEGARVLEPKTGLHTKPVFCLDYASLYPTIMMSHNICPTTKVVDPKYVDSGNVTTKEVTFALYSGNKKTGTKTVSFVQPCANTRAVLPSIEETLKRKRSETRAKMKWKRIKLVDGSAVGGILTTRDSEISILTPEGTKVSLHKDDVLSISDYFNDMEINVLNGMQLAYKVTGNSLYGAQGASTSDIRDMDCAAAITSVGRGLLEMARDFLEGEGCTVVYGDTDSCFATTKVYDSSGNEVTGIASVPLVIARAKELQNKFLALLPSPHVCEYEKVYYPWILLSKKRYVGYKYEEATDVPKFSYNGIVLVRRDNCEALRDVVSNLCKHLLGMDVPGAVSDLQKSIDDLVDGRVPLDKLTITKTLSDSYKKPEQIAHWVLAQRMGIRDPARKPRANERVPYAFVVTKDPKALQGDRIECPEFILQNNLEVDYAFYLENQLVTPVCQMLATVVDQLPGYRLPPNHWDVMQAQLMKCNLVQTKGDLEEAESLTRKEIDDEKSKHVYTIFFRPIMTRLTNRKNKQRDIRTFFTQRPKI